MDIDVRVRDEAGATKEQFISELKDAVEDLNEEITEFKNTLPADQQADFAAQAKSALAS